MSCIQESGEMYLETILVLCEKNEHVRASDVAKEMNYSKPSVSRGMSILKENNMIKTDDNGYIELTDDGRNLAKKIYERHLILTKYLVGIGVDRTTAEADACKIEHVISDESFSAIKAITE